MHIASPKPCEMKNKNMAGFSLIELSIVLIIMGLVMSASMAMLKVNMAGRDFLKTKRNIEKAEAALASYLEFNGAFPCPASREAVKNTTGFGKALDDCISYEDGKRTLIATKKDTANALGRDEKAVNIGILPFRSLGISDADALDGWGSLLQYAVTESLTLNSTYDQKQGAIDIVAEDDQSRITPAGSAQYVIYSTGQDRASAYTATGAPTGVPCPKKTQQEENCDDDATFMEAEKTYGTQRGKKGTHIVYDDVIGYIQYKTSKVVTEGMVLPYVESCPSDFKQIDANGIQVIDGDPLTVTPIFDQSISNNIHSQVIFCHTALYSITITVIEDENAEESACPPDWTAIGYKAINPQNTGSNSSNYPVCAK